MATLVVDASLRSDAAAILRRFETLQDEFKSKDPIEFKKDMEAIAKDVEALTQLRTRFNVAYQNRALIPDLSKEELLNVYDQWNDANKILSSLEATRIVTEDYEKLAKATEEQEKNFDPVTVGNLVHTTRSIFYQSVMTGVKEAYGTLNQRLTTLLHVKVPVSPAVPPRPATPSILVRTDEESHLNDLWAAWNVSSKDFKHAMQLYQNATAYLAGKKGSNQFVSAATQAGFSEFSKKMTDTISSKIAEQKALEETAKRKCESYDFFTTNFGAVKTALFSNETSQFKFNQALAEAYRALPSNLKEDLRDAVATETRTNLSDKKYVDDKQFTLVNWPGTIDQKRAALKTFIPDVPPSPVANLSSEMEIKLNTALLTRSIRLEPTPPAPAAVPAAPKTVPAFSRAIDDLQRVVELFTLGKSADAQFEMTRLASAGITLNGTNAADRVNFHMYLIDRNAGKPINDPNYGANAFQGVIPADDNDRILAIRRTMIEASLEGLKESYAANQTDVNAYLDLLESKQELIAAAGGNLAHKLFGTVYQIYSDARALNASLHDPNDGKVFGDFGRSVMSNTAKIDTQFKLEAVRKIEDELKTVWKV